MGCAAQRGGRKELSSEAPEMLGSALWELGMSVPAQDQRGGNRTCAEGGNAAAFALRGGVESCHAAGLLAGEQLCRSAFLELVLVVVFLS